MSDRQPPAHRTPEPEHPVTPSGAPRLFEARHEPREALTIVLVGGIGTAVAGVGTVFLARFAGTGDGPFPTEPGPLRIVALVMLVFFATFGTALAAAVLAGLVRALRRALIVRIDGDGLTLQRRRWWGRDRFIPWRAVRGLSAYTTTRRDGDGTSTVHWFQVDLTDGTLERRPLDRTRYSWASMAEVVRTVAPRTALNVEGEVPLRRG